MQKIFSEVTSHYTHVVFDLPSVWSPLVKFILSQVDTTLHVLRPEVNSVQTAVRVERLIQTKGPELSERYFVLNQTNSEAQLGRATVERGLNVAVDFHVEFDTAQSKAMIQGMPVAVNQTDSAIAIGVAAIAEKLSQTLLVTVPGE